jgi:hypothetical protein
MALTLARPAACAPKDCFLCDDESVAVSLSAFRALPPARAAPPPAAMQRAAAPCPECRSATRVVCDETRGELVCTECGRVVASHLFGASFEDGQRTGAPVADDAAAGDAYAHAHALGTGAVGGEDRALRACLRRAACAGPHAAGAWRARLEHVAANAESWLPPSVPHLAAAHLALVLSVHTFGAREAPAVLAALLAHGAAAAGVTRYDFTVYALAAGACEEAYTSGACARARALVAAVARLHARATAARRVAWAATPEQLVSLLCDEGPACGELARATAAAAVRRLRATGAAERHSALVVAAAAYAHATRAGASAAAKLAGVSAAAPATLLRALDDEAAAAAPLAPAW